VNVHRGNRMLDGAKKIAVEKSVEVARQPTLNTDFRSTAVPGFARTTDDFVERERVGIGGARSAAKAAETATDETDVREVDVPIYNVGDCLPNGLAPQVIRDGDQRFQR
jgi:hypothetical protein